MDREIIWTSAASEDYLNADSTHAPTVAIDRFLNLAILFPEIGSLVTGSKSLRRGLIGRKRLYGLYYSIQPGRLVVVALLDLRQDSTAIERALASRRP